MHDRVILGGLLVAIAGAAFWVQAATPNTLVAQPERPDRGLGDSTIRIESQNYPRYATGADGYRTRIDAPPRRIVSQYWSVDEFLYSIVPPERVIAVSETAYSEASSNLLDIVGRLKPVIAANPEAVLRTQPDLVLAGESVRWEVTGVLREAGLPVYRVFTSFERLHSIEEHMRLIGYLTGEDTRAAEEIEKFRGTIARAVARRPAGARAPRILGMAGSYTYGRKTLFDDIARTVGAENLAATNGLEGYSRATDEHIVRWNPDWIFAGAARGRVEAARKDLLARPAVAATSAAKNGRVIVVSDEVFLPMSPYSARLVDEIARVLYPEVPVGH